MLLYQKLNRSLAIVKWSSFFILVDIKMYLVKFGPCIKNSKRRVPDGRWEDFSGEESNPEEVDAETIIGHSIS